MANKKSHWSYALRPKMEKLYTVSKNKTQSWLSIQFSSVAQSYPTLCDAKIAARQASLSITNSWSLLRLTSIESVMPSSHLILCHPLLLLPPSPPSIRVFSNESTLLIRWPKYWRLSFSIVLPMNIKDSVSLRLVWSPWSPRDSQESSPTPQFKTSILSCPAFFMVQLSHS